MAKRRCDHCHLEYEETFLLKDTSFSSTHYFCCKGCQGVFHLLKEEGLNAFYEKKGDIALNPPSSQDNEDLARFDVETFLSKYVKKEGEFCEISLIIEGIHCSACVWLNEKVLSKQEGIVEVSINYSNHKAKILWDAESIKLSHIIETIRSIGYNAYPYDPKSGEERANATRREYYSKLLVGIFATMNVMWIAIAQYAGYFTGMQDNVKNILNFAAFVLATPTLFYTGSVYFKGAYYSLKHGHVSMDSLVATGATLTYLFSIYAMLTKSTEVYFDSVTMIITFVFAGKYLEVLTKKKAVDTLDSFGSAMPSEVLVVKEEVKTFVSVDAVSVGEIIEVHAGERVAIDGIITQGEASFDLSSLSGESMPVLMGNGDKLLSGSICLDSVVRYQALSSFSSSIFSKMIALLQESLHKKPHIEKLANQLSGYFSATILALALLTFAGWTYSSGSFEKALIVAISVIVIACPCALSLATPVATLVGLGIGAKRGILFKEASFLESLAKCDTLIFDKTGTLTQGAPFVVEEHIVHAFDPSLLYAIASASDHPISKGIVRHIGHQRSIKPLQLGTIKIIQAKGVRATFGGHTLLGGSVQWMQEEKIPLIIPEPLKAMSHYCFAIDGEIVALFGLRDTLKEDAKQSVQALRDLGLRMVILSGDHADVTREIATEVGIQEFKANLLPHEKAEYIEQQRQQGHKVVMVGDGINDALALSQSEVAIAMGSGADIAVEMSDVVLMKETIHSVYEALKIARKTLRTIKQNLAFSLLYNLVTIPLAMMGYVIPLVAAISMSLSSLVVVGNAMRMHRFFKT